MGSVKSYAHKAWRIEHQISAMGCEFTVMVYAAIVRSAGTGGVCHGIHIRFCFGPIVHAAEDVNVEVRKIHCLFLSPDHFIHNFGIALDNFYNFR